MDWNLKERMEQKENLPILKQKENRYNRFKGIRIGDWLKDHKTGKDEKNNPTLYQTTEEGDAGSFYLGDGYMSFSGSLNHGYETKLFKFRKLPYKRNGRVWFFKNRFATAHNGIEYPMKFRVFEVFRRK